MGMSDDESDHTAGKRSRRSDRQYKIVNDNWRNPAIRRWLRIFDLLYLDSKFGLLNRAAKGTWPRVRNPSYKVVISKPVLGLPENFYDPLWLASLSEEKRRALKMVPALTLNFDEETLRCGIFLLFLNVVSKICTQSIAAKYAHVNNETADGDIEEEQNYYLNFIEWLEAQGPPDGQNYLI